MAAAGILVQDKEATTPVPVQGQITEQVAQALVLAVVQALQQILLAPKQAQPLRNKTRQTPHNKKQQTLKTLSTRSSLNKPLLAQQALARPLPVQTPVHSRVHPQRPATSSVRSPSLQLQRKILPTHERKSAAK
jgi:Tfp pilus assembly protein FimT